LDSQSIEHWGRWGRGGGRVISCLRKAKWGRGHEFFFFKPWGYFGGGGATFFTAKISPNGDPKINPLILSKGFFMKNFNNFGNKKRKKKRDKP